MRTIQMEILLGTAGIYTAHFYNETRVVWTRPMSEHFLVAAKPE